METPEVPRSTRSLYPERLDVAVTASMARRLIAQARERDLSISATVRLGLLAWLNSAEKRQAA